MKPGEVLMNRSDLLSTFHTKRTPIIKVHHTPRNMVMVGGSYIPPSSTTSGLEGQD
jgi:transcription initiation factor TFIID subunit 5